MQPTTENQGLATASILIVDDDPAIRLVLQRYLLGARNVFEAENAEAAESVMRDHEVDLVLLDVNLPGMSGTDLCRSLKSREQGFLPVLMLTADDWQDARNEGLAAGADDFLVKPVDRRELLMRAQAFLKLRRQERAIQEHLAELQRAQLQKDYLFKLIVHDLRNPLFAASGQLRLVADELEPGGRTSRSAEVALAALTEMSEILDIVGEVYRLEEGKRKLEKETVSAGLIAREAVQNLAGSQEGIHLEVQVEGDPTVTLDRSLARRAVEILLRNALTYSAEEDPVVVMVNARPDGAELEVLDRGPGVPDELKATLFDKFGSVQGWRTAARRGLGESLYLVKLIAEAHGGTVEVRDREGGGSVMRLFFPRG